MRAEEPGEKTKGPIRGPRKDKEEFNTPGTKELGGKRCLGEELEFKSTKNPGPRALKGKRKRGGRNGSHKVLDACVKGE